MADKTDERPIEGLLEAAASLAAKDEARTGIDAEVAIRLALAEGERRAKARRRRFNALAFALPAAAALAVAIGFGAIRSYRDYEAARELSAAMGESVALLLETSSDMPSFIGAAFPDESGIPGEGFDQATQEAPIVFEETSAGDEPSLASDTRSVIDALWAESDSWSAFALEASYSGP